MYLRAGLLSGFPQLIAQIDGRVFTLLSETAGLFHEFFQVRQAFCAFDADIVECICLCL